MNQDSTIMADLHTIKVANFWLQPLVFFKLQPLSFKPSKKSTSSTSHPYCEKMFFQNSQPPTLAIFCAITGPAEHLSPINGLSLDDKVFNPPRFLETVKERLPIQVGFHAVWAGWLGSSLAMSVRMIASPSGGFVLNLMFAVPQ